MTDPTNPRSLAQRTEEPITQVRAITTLLALIQEEGTPSTQWRVADADQLGYRSMADLEGHLLTGTDTEKRRGLSTWQRIIGAGPVEVRDSGPREHLIIRGSYDGVSVQVITIVDACCAYCQDQDGHPDGDAA